MLMWEDNVLNASDVMQARRYCERYDINLTVIEHNYEEFLRDHQHLHYGETYRTNSPQIAFHLKFVHSLGNSRPIMMGGECPKITWCPVQQKSLFSYYNPATYIQPFDNLAQAHNLDCVERPAETGCRNTVPGSS
jgi:hypothetical protein